MKRQPPPKPPSKQPKSGATTFRHPKSGKYTPGLKPQPMPPTPMPPTPGATMPPMRRGSMP